MGFFNFCTPKNQKNKTDAETVSNSKCENQISLIPQTLSQLKQIGVNESSNLKLEYFFYTKSEKNAEELSKKLINMKYSSEFRLGAGNTGEYVVTGWTIPMKMDEKTIANWTREMCKFAEEYQSDFDGWGTSPEQN